VLATKEKGKLVTSYPNDKCLHESPQDPCDYCRSSKLECGPKLFRNGQVANKESTIGPEATVQSKLFQLTVSDDPIIEENDKSQTIIEMNVPVLGSPKLCDVSEGQTTNEYSTVATPNIEQVGVRSSLGPFIPEDAIQSDEFNTKVCMLPVPCMPMSSLVLNTY
jgi:hypothetical protein